MSDSLDTDANAAEAKNFDILDEVEHLHRMIEFDLITDDLVSARLHVGKLARLAQNWQAALPKETP